jgi:hypothetical protein
MKDERVMVREKETGEVRGKRENEKLSDEVTLGERRGGKARGGGERKIEGERDGWKNREIEWRERQRESGRNIEKDG